MLFLTCMQYGVYKDLHEIKVLHVFLIKWAYCLWYTYERLVITWNHFFVWASIRRLYVFCFKIAYHLSFQVTMAAYKTQNVWNILTKVSDKVCWSGWTLYKVCKETFNSHFNRTAEGQIKKRKIPKIKRKKVLEWNCLIRILKMTEEKKAPQSPNSLRSKYSHSSYCAKVGETAKKKKANKG